MEFSLFMMHSSHGKTVAVNHTLSVEETLHLTLAWQTMSVMLAALESPMRQHLYQSLPHAAEGVSETEGG